MPREYYKKRIKFINDFKVNLENNKVKLPSITKKGNIIKENNASWFQSEKIKMKHVVNNTQYKNKKVNQVFSCLKIKMLLTNEQKNIINKWFHSYIDMYNATLKYVKTECSIFRGVIIRSQLTQIDMNKYGNLINLRNKLKDIRDIIKLKSGVNGNNEIHTHTLDYAISLFVSNLKSAVTNTYRGNFKKFSMKYMKHNKNSKILEIEKCYIRNNMICPNILGEIKYEYNGKDYNLPELVSNVKINYNGETDEYRLLIPIKNILF